MQFSSAFAACMFVTMLSTSALADSRVFIVANQADSYGIDQCLANGEKCGGPAARIYCQSQNFTHATSYRRIASDEVTGTVFKMADTKATETCGPDGCGEYVAITCQR